MARPDPRKGPRTLRWGAQGAGLGDRFAQKIDQRRQNARVPHTGVGKEKLHHATLEARLGRRRSGRVRAGDEAAASSRPPSAHSHTDLGAGREPDDIDRMTETLMGTGRD